MNWWTVWLHSTHLYLSQMFLSFLFDLVFHFFVYGPNNLIMFTLPSKREQIKVELICNSTQLNRLNIHTWVHWAEWMCIGLYKRRRATVTCVELVPGCLSLSWSPVSGTLCEPGHLPGCSAALVCVAAAHTTESRAPRDWHTTHDN